MAGYIGLKDANTFNWLATTQPNGAPWTVLDEMADRRWYPTVTTLIDGRMLTIAGQRYGGLHSVIPEIWNNGTWSRLLNAANLELKDYPWMFAAPNDPVTGQGRVFYAGPTWDSRYLNTSTGVWSTTIYPTRYNQPRHPSLWREAGSAVMFDKGKILVVGGGIDTNIDNTAEWIDLTAAVPTWRPAGTMQFARKHVNATLLPDGRVLITGGTRTGSINEFDAVLVPEIWTPPTTPTGPGTWNTVPLAPMQVPRLYHSTALLLPDGRVLSTGGGAGGNFERHADYEVYSPPYLCGTAPRPQITGAPVAMQYGQPFSVTVTDAAGANIAIGSLRLIRLASVTHSFDMNQRGLTLPFAQAGNALSTTAPLNDWCPPGHYLLFAVSSAGVPSEARIVSVTPNPCGVSLNLTVSSQPPTTSCATQRLVTASGLNLGNAYEWTIDGVAVPNNSTSSLSLTQGLEGSSQFQNRVRVSVTPTCGGPPATATVLVTSYFPDCQFR